MVEIYKHPKNNMPIIEAPIFLNQAIFMFSAFVILTKKLGHNRNINP